jgi:DNA-binding LacI/PurR family transcriptional regulator
MIHVQHIKIHILTYLVKPFFAEDEKNVNQSYQLLYEKILYIFTISNEMINGYQNMKMEDIAKKMGVSRVTVSRIINGHDNVSAKTRKRVLDYIKETGYQPNLAARTLSKKKSDIIGIVCSHAYNILVSQMLTTILSELSKNSKQAMMLLTKNDATEKAAILSLTRKTVEGLVIFSNFCDSEFLGNITRENKNMVFNGPGPKGALAVRTDHIKGMKQIMSYLFKMHHKRIIYLGAPIEMQFSGNDERQKGYIESMQQYSLDPQIYYANEVDPYSGYKVAKNILLSSSQRPTAIVCYNDELALGVMRAAQELHISVPEQLSITGYDGLDLLKYIKPTLTTYRLSPIEVGKLLIDTLFKQLNSEENLSGDIWIEGEFIVGESASVAMDS